jgi:glycosyltransferase involved in cell wall biosynthesis
MEISKKQISFLITHYNRPDDLAKCLAAVRNLNLQDSEIVVCDDASHEKHLKIIQDYQIDQLVAEVNQGLAANINRYCSLSGEYIVYCQEDFILNPKIIEILPECMGLLKEEKVDMIRFTSNSVLIN